MRIPTGSIVTACALSVMLLVAGCVHPGVKAARMGGDVYLVPAAAQGPDPFTGSTVTGTGEPAVPDAAGADPTATRTPGVSSTGPPPATSSGPALPAALVAAPLSAVRVLSGATPGLYGGTAGVAGCDVQRQIAYLTADRDRGDAFAHAAGISASGIPGYLHGLTPVVLRADTRVTSHGYRAGKAVGHQAVLQAGTAVLVDDRGVPRVRCACGNPLGWPAPARGGFGARGTAWSGYRPGQVIAVTPAPRAVTSITLVNAHARTWIRRRIGHDVRDDQVVPAPAGAATAPGDSPAPTATTAATAPPYDALPRPAVSGPRTPPGATGRPPAALPPTALDPFAGRTTTAPATAVPLTPPFLGPAPAPPDAHPDPGPDAGPLDDFGLPAASHPPDAANLPAAPGLPDGGTGLDAPSGSRPAAVSGTTHGATPGTRTDLPGG
ncbi:hypothetical protein GCM10010260_71350 [Streptomyces filipinensis]|uniref:DUF6777 domain-containing protein n=1 Tax=Streptomyces filipinensis TaxID=66887 RepID=A0A918ME54_9ACTN|nr:DUF6777 domain-containing protein [Streptomyces filipinensis]GGV20900.1 hypothetical protein GCM10010260_71350 [Streptomyces filipinensis]